MSSHVSVIKGIGPMAVKLFSECNPPIHTAQQLYDAFSNAEPDPCISRYKKNMLAFGTSSDNTFISNIAQYVIKLEDN